MGARIDMVGKRYNHWTVIAEAEPSPSGRIRYMCRCDCGFEKIIHGETLRYGHTHMCAGCVVKEQRAKKQSRKALKGETRVSDAPPGGGLRPNAWPAILPDARPAGLWPLRRGNGAEARNLPAAAGLAGAG